MGGKVAMTLALLHRELVERLCVVDVSPVATRQTAEFATFVRGMRAIDLTNLTDRKAADAQLADYVSDPTIRSFLLQNLRREFSPAGEGWRWQMNLELLGDQLDKVGAWPEPDVHLMKDQCSGWPAPPPALHPARVRRCHAGPSFPRTRS
jgi:pimeloyl-ACP methyl ester carboxylesterase